MSPKHLLLLLIAVVVITTYSSLVDADHYKPRPKPYHPPKHKPLSDEDASTTGLVDEEKEVSSIDGKPYKKPPPYHKPWPPKPDLDHEPQKQTNNPEKDDEDRYRPPHHRPPYHRPPYYKPPTAN